MIALTCDFNVFASRVTAGLSAVFFSVRHITQARYVRTLLGHLIRHVGSILFAIFRPSRYLHPLHSGLQSQFAARTGLPQLLLSEAKFNDVSSVGRLIARRYLDSSEAPSAWVELKTRCVRGGQVFQVNALVAL
jgi:hypothetical protein